jgi:tRNA/rRNA methyltransferase
MQPPSIILSKPQLGENIGMVARAMLNCGLTDLRIITPRDGWPNPAAVSASSGALEKGVDVGVFDTTEDAISDLSYVLATTARPRDMIKTVFTPETAVRELSTQYKENNVTQYGVLFGGERAGLDNEDIALCNAIITAPLNPDYTSLNLAQAVLLIGYEWTKQVSFADTKPKELVIGSTEIATKENVSRLVDRLEQELDNRHFFRSEDARPTTLRNLMNLFARMDITQQEVQTFHGIISALIGQKSKTKDNK